MKNFRHALANLLPRRSYRQNDLLEAMSSLYPERRGRYPGGVAALSHAPAIAQLPPDTISPDDEQWLDTVIEERPAAVGCGPDALCSCC